MAKPDPKHQQACKEFVVLEAAEAKRRIGISDYRTAGYVSSEVLASVVRARFGQHGGLLDVAARALFERIVRLVGAYLRKNSHWRGVANSSSETLNEINSYIWDKLIGDPSATCFAEVRFLTFVEARVEDYLRSRLAQKNQMKSLDSMHSRDEEGRERQYADLIKDETTDTPEIAAIRLQTTAVLNRALLALEPLERRAVHFRVQCEMGWDETATALGCSIPTAKKHLDRGLDKLRGVQV